MAEPTYTGNPGVGPSILIIDAKIGNAEDIYNTYGFRTAIIKRIAHPCDAAMTFQGNNVSSLRLEWLEIYGTGSPNDVDTYDGAAGGSLYIDYTNTDLYMKNAEATWELVSAQT